MSNRYIVNEWVLGSNNVHVNTEVYEKTSMFNPCAVFVYSALEPQHQVKKFASIVYHWSKDVVWKGGDSSLYTDILSDINDDIKNDYYFCRNDIICDINFGISDDIISNHYWY